MHWQVKLSVKTKFFVFTYILHGFKSALIKIRKAPNITQQLSVNRYAEYKLVLLHYLLPIYLVNHT